MNRFMSTDVRVAMGRWQRVTEDQIRVRAPGRIKAAVRGTRIWTRGYHCGTTVESLTGFSLYPEEGTGVFVGRGRIYPKRAKALRFISRRSGGVVFAKSIKGQPGQHFMRNGLFASTFILYGGRSI